MKNMRNIKSLTVLIAFLLVMGACVGTTLAYLIDKTDSVVNTFNPTSVTNKVVEDFNGTVKENVRVQNTGTIDAYIRATVVVTWKNEENGQVLGQLPVAGTDYTIAYNTDVQVDYGNGKWELIDGYYYWSNPVAPGATTGILITKCEPVAGRTPANYGLNVEIIAQSIQTEPEAAVNAWKGGEE